MLKNLMKWSTVLCGSMTMAVVGGCDGATLVTDLINQLLGTIVPQ